MIWHSSSVEETLSELNSDKNRGLTRARAAELSKKLGENRVVEQRDHSYFEGLFPQLKMPLFLVLVLLCIASIVYLLIKKEFDITMPVAVICIGVIGAFFSALIEKYAYIIIKDANKKIFHKTKVIRDAEIQEVDSATLVPGDIILLESGDYIPADARIIECEAFRCDEAMLTGEEVNSEKDADVICTDITPINERVNMVYCGCSVTSGNAKAVVTEIGMKNEIGKNKIIERASATSVSPLRTQLSKFSKKASVIIIAICVALFIVSYIFGMNKPDFHFVDGLITMLSVALAAVPKGLSAIVVICLSLGIKRMHDNRAVVKKMNALETLDSVSVICTEKTGNLTQNKMKVVQVFSDNKIYYAVDDFSEQVNSVLKLGAICCNSDYIEGEDPTEIAIIDAATEHLSMDKIMLDSIYPRMNEIPFDPERKLMSVVCIIEGKPFVIVKGGAEIIIEKCVETDKEGMKKAAEEMAKDSLRVLGIAIKPLDEIPSNPTPEELETELNFVGLVGLIDPPQQEVKYSIEECLSAGIKTVMITGEHAATATAIAKRLGILKDGQLVVTGEELSSMSDDELSQKIENISVYARVSPEDKIRIVRVWQEKGEVVAITGSSVEDGPSLQAADVGCAMSDGTDVAKGCADIVLEDNSYSTVASAICEGRGIYRNIKSMVNYILSGHLGIMVAAALSVFDFSKSAVTAPQVLWLSLVTALIPASALGMDFASSDVMTKTSRKRISTFTQSKFISNIIWQGAVIGITTFVAFLIGGNTMAFLTLALSQMVQVFVSRFDGVKNLLYAFKSKYILSAIGIILALLLLLFLTSVKAVFDLVAISFTQVLISFALSLVTLMVSFVIELARRKR